MPYGYGRLRTNLYFIHQYELPAGADHDEAYDESF
jgi:hypothetical protein